MQIFDRSGNLPLNNAEWGETIFEGGFEYSSLHPPAFLLDIHEHNSQELIGEKADALKMFLQK